MLHPFLPDAFLPLMMWRFVREFPVDIQRPSAGRVASVCVSVSFGVGLVLLAINAVGRFGDITMPAWFMALFELLDRDHPERVYWPLLFAAGAPAIPFLLWKTRLEADQDRRRVMLFVGGLAVGLTPFVLAVVRHAIRAGAAGIRRCNKVLASSSTRHSRRLCRSPPTPSRSTV